MALFRLFSSDPVRDQAERLYCALVAQARAPVFYIAAEVPDSLDGRFDMVALHAFLVLRRLKSDSGAGAALSRAVAESFVADMDRSLREMGAGDLGVGRRVQAMTQGLFGRIGAYEDGLARGDASLAEALRRNLYGTVAGPGRPSPASLAAMCGYVRASVTALAGCSLADLGAGRLAFGPPPRGPGAASIVPAPIGTAPIGSTH